MSIAISDALQQAEQANRSGDYRSAIQTCNQLVRQFPDYAAAYRVLGEAYLGQGNTAEAEQAFAQALQRDPREPVAYHGLGLIAENQNVLDNALAFCQVAWELAPNQPDLRDHVIRIATRQFGADGQAQLTSAALAQIYANTSRLQRAAIEFRSALADLPDRNDLKLGLAQTLWRLGKDEAAADLCRQVLDELPVAIQALVILADIEGRNGHDTEAADLRARIRAIDPDGRITAMMVAQNVQADRDALLLADTDVPVLDHTADSIVAERPHIAPAPDFSYQPAHAEPLVQDIEDLEPISAEEFGGVAEDNVDDISDQITSELPPAETDEHIDEPAVLFDEETDDAPSIFREDDHEIDLVLPEADEAGDEVAAEAAVEDPLQFSDEEDFDALMAEFGDVEPMGLDEFGAEPEDLERLAAVEQDLLADDDLFAGFDLSSSASDGENEHVQGLASALEEDIAGALDRTGEFQTIEEEPIAETTEPQVDEEPDPLSGTGYTTVLRELGDEGLTPFDPLGRPDLQESQPQAGDTGDAAADAGDDELLKLTQDWDTIDDEIARAVPITTGQTDQLRAADDLGIDPFDFEIEDDTSRLPAYRPFGEDDDELTSMEADEIDDALPLDIEAELAAEEVEEAVIAEAQEAHAETQAQETDAPSLDDDLFANLEPFSLEEIDEQQEARTAPGFSFGALPWETTESGESDTLDVDLESLLTPEDQVQPVIEEQADDIEQEQPAAELESDAPDADEPPVDWTTAIQDTQPAPTPWNIPDDFDTSLAVTRQISGSRDNLVDRLADVTDPSEAETGELEPEASTPLMSADTGLLRGPDPEQLVEDEDLFERSRSAKTDLISQGTISGDQPLTEEPAQVEAEPEPEPDELKPAASAESVQEVEAEEDDFVVSTAASRDVNTLRASLEAAPDDDELHWWLAEALRERGDIPEAYNEYRWLIRNAPHRGDEVAEAIHVCIEDEQHAEMGHRLLGDLYRRRGQVSLASSHAAAAMAVRRKLRG